MPSRSLFRAELNHVGDDTDRGPGRANPFLLRDEFLEHVVLDRAAHALPWHPLALRIDQVHRQQDRSRAIYRHRSGDLIDRNPIEQARHVMNRTDRYSFASDLAVGALMVGVIAYQG